MARLRTSSMLWSVPLLAALAGSSLPLGAQQWTTERLRDESEDFHTEGIVPRLRQIAELLAQRELCFDALCASIHGDHREYLLKVERVLDQLADERWLAREDAERTLVEIGGRALAQIEERAKSGRTLEERIRAKRALGAITARGTEAEEREIRFLRGFVATAAYFPGNDKLARALISALGHTDPRVVELAVLALGAVGDDRHADFLAARIPDRPGAIGRGLRGTALTALTRLRGEAALERVRELLASDDVLTTSEVTAIVRDLTRRADTAAILETLGAHDDPIVVALAGLSGLSTAGDGALPARFVLGDNNVLEKRFLGLTGGGVLVEEPVEGLPFAELTVSECDTVEFDHPDRLVDGATRLFLTQGSLITGAVVGADAESIRFESPVFGALEIPRSQIQGVAIDPTLDRLVGASGDHDRVRLKRDNAMVDCEVIGMDAGGLRVRTLEPAGEKTFPLADIAGVLFRRPRNIPQDSELYTRVDLVNGDRLLAHVGYCGAAQIGLAVPDLGGADVPMTQVNRMEFGVGGGALWGFTLIADYSDNRIIEVDDKGTEVYAMEEVYGAWDVECLDSGNLLITEFALNRVVEVTRDGQEEIWSYEDLKNPYDADRLQNGNTLIADTFGDRVVEVDREGNVVWQYEGEIKPYDVNRLASGNTLIADGRKDRVLEVDASGRIVWELSKMESVHDVDRLPNGNTLITQRTLHRVIEVDRDGNIVFKLENLSSPSDADRLPNGHTIVAENGGVREFDRRGKQVWEREVSWAVEVNRY